MKIKFNQILLIGVSGFVILINSCKKRDQYIPFVDVDIYINVNQPAYFH